MMHDWHVCLVRLRAIEKQDVNGWAYLICYCLFIKCVIIICLVFVIMRNKVRDILHDLLAKLSLLHDLLKQAGNTLDFHKKKL
jgi:hypothetical protein